MNKIKSTCILILFILVNPITISLYTLIFSVIIWGPGIVAIGFALITGALSGVAKILFFSKNYKHQQREKRLFACSISCLGIAILLQGLQYWSTSGDSLKASLFDDSLKDEFEVINSDVKYVGGEEEFCLELSASKPSVEKFLLSKNFHLKSDGFIKKPSYFPKWWTQDYSGFSCYEYNLSRKQEYHLILVSEDYKKVFYYHLYY